MALTDNVLLAATPSLLDGGAAYTNQGASEAAGGNHLDERPAKVTLISTMTPYASTFSGVGSIRGILDWVGIVNHNLDRRRGSLWRAWARAVGDGVPPGVDTLEELYPNGSADVSNSTGSHTDVDDNPWLASVDFVGAAAAGTWSRRFSFATPSALSAIGTATAFDSAIVLRAASSAPGGGGTLTVKLYEAGSPVATLLNAAAVGTGDELERSVYICTFNTSQLATASGADVEIQVEGSNVTRLHSLLWVSGVQGMDRDSGFLAVDAPPASSEFGSSSAGAAGEEPTQNDFAIFSSPLTYSGSERPYIRVAMVNGTNAASPVNKLGVLAAGKLWQPPKTAAVSIAVSDPSTKGETLGGQDYGSNRRRRRLASVTLEDLTRAQMLELFERLDWRKGRLGAFFVCLFPNDAYGKRITGFWATLGESEVGGVWEPYNASDGNDTASVIRWRRTYQFQERL